MREVIQPVNWGQPSVPTSLESVKQHIDGYVSGRVQDRDDRDEVAQLCLIKVWRKGHTFRGESAFKSWLYRLVRNEIVDWSRREGRRVRGLGKMDWHVRSRVSLEDTAIADVEVQRLLSLANGVDREILEMTCVQGLTSAGVGEILGIAASSVRARLARLRRARSERDMLTASDVVLDAAG